MLDNSIFFKFSFSNLSDILHLDITFHIEEERKIRKKNWNVNQFSFLTHLTYEFYSLSNFF